MKEVEGGKPPSNIRQPITSRIRVSFNDRCIARRREMALLHHLSSPCIASRLRNDLAILETV